MKNFISASLLFFPIFLFGQLTFEEVSIPPDFSIKYLVQSPTGEYFAQGMNEYNSIYTSQNGVDWVQSNFPKNHDLVDVQFFDDGTPLIKGTSYQIQVANSSHYPFPKMT